MQGKRAFIIHGWGGFPGEAWIPWLKQQLEQKGFKVEALDMPDTDSPTISAWVGHLSTAIGQPNENTFLIGHSIGCQTILRYLETLPANTKIGGAVFVAGWFTLMNLEPEEEPSGKPWLETPIDTEKVKQHVNQMIAIFSDDDDVVPLDNKEMFEQRLGAKTIVEHGKGHFSGGDNINELPVALDSVLEIC
jgi:predicted alpha/beta hydrolase family esterase